MVRTSKWVGQRGSIWGPVTLFLFLATGIWFTFGDRLVSLSKIGLIFRNALGTWEKTGARKKNGISLSGNVYRLSRHNGCWQYYRNRHRHDIRRRRLYILDVDQCVFRHDDEICWFFGRSLPAKGLLAILAARCIIWKKIGSRPAVISAVCASLPPSAWEI